MNALAPSSLSAPLLGLTGCFQPLYGEAVHPGLTEAMREVQVVPIKDRIGHYLVDDLIARMNGSGRPRFRNTGLRSSSTAVVQTPTVESQIGIATSATVVGHASFELKKIEGEEVVYRGEATAFAPFDRSFQNYANLRASRDADLRIARSLSQEIELRVAAALGDNIGTQPVVASPTAGPT